VLQINVWRETDASGEFKVSPQGSIHHYLVGEVGVAGQTLDEIAGVIRSALALGYLRDPRVSVSVSEYQAHKVSVYGDVVHPGVYALSGETDLLRLLLDAGGPKGSADGKCTLLHVEKTPEGEVVQSSTILLDELLGQGDLSKNWKVSSGDVIYVHPRKETRPSNTPDPDERTYYVLGEVKNPGAYRYKEGVSALSAILEAGGFSEYARSNKTKLVREESGKQETRIVKMGDLMSKGDRTLDVTLLPGDVLVVPKSLF
jgi:polysaccharide export outer membrane protein